MIRAKPQTASGLVVQVFSMSWLWSIFAGFYLVAYTFWVPDIIPNIVAVVLLIILTLALGGGLLFDGFSAALKLQGGSSTRTLPLTRLRRAAGGVLLLAYLAVYIPASGRIVAHWPLDLAITLVAGGIMVAHAIAGIE